MFMINEYGEIIRSDLSNECVTPSDVVKNSKEE